MNSISMGFWIKEEFLNDHNKINSCKTLAERKAKEAIAKFITNDWTGEKITIEEGEWIIGIPHEDSPNVIPFRKTFYIKREDK